MHKDRMTKRKKMMDVCVRIAPHVDREMAVVDRVVSIAVHGEDSGVVPVRSEESGLVHTR